MTAFSRSSNLAAYQAVSVHGGVAASDPHRLVLMLMDGALERILSARGAIENGVPEARSHLLNLDVGGELAANMAELYEYSSRQLMRANLEARIEPLDDVAKLLREIRSAWIQIAPRP
jgi:flagellar secretion chaperone FliS